jgi:HD-like signal output (HDOD) protein
VLQDFALTSKLLRLANQAATGRSGISNITVAISLLGMAQVRVAATGLMLAAPLAQAPRDPDLTEAIRGAFVAGVIGWNLGRLQRMDNSEELFICSMFSRLGEILTIYYFPEEFAEIRRQAQQGAAEATVVRSVLGIGYAELGVEIARRWNFPEVILQAQAPLPAGVVPAARHRGERLAHCAAFARELCQLADRGPLGRIAPLVEQLRERYALAAPCSVEQLQSLLQQSIAIAGQYCRAAGVPGDGGRLIEALASWCSQAQAKPAAPAGTSASRGREA